MRGGVAVAVGGGGLIAGATGIMVMVILVPLLSWTDPDKWLSMLSGSLNVAAIPEHARSYAPYIEAAGSMCPEITPALIAGQIQSESSWDRYAKSPKGALGLSQFMPKTFAGLGRDEDGLSGGIADPFDPQDAIMAQGRYDCNSIELIRQMQAGTYRGGCGLDTGERRPPPAKGEFPQDVDIIPFVIAGYNAGLGAVCYYRGVPDFPETQSYVPAVLAAAAKYLIPDATAKPGDGGVGSVGGGPSCSPSAGMRRCAMQKALEQVGKYPYSWGGGNSKGPSFGVRSAGLDGTKTFGFDCSGLVQFAYFQGSSGETRLTLPRLADSQIKTGEVVAAGYGSPTFDLSKVQPGDAVGFGDGPGYFYHIAIYIGGGEVVNALKPGTLLQRTPLSAWHGEYWRFSRFTEPPEPGKPCANCDVLAAGPRKAPSGDLLPLASGFSSLPPPPSRGAAWTRRVGRRAPNRRPGHPRARRSPGHHPRAARQVRRA